MTRSVKIVAMVGVFLLLTVGLTAYLVGAAGKRYQYVACASEVIEMAQRSGGAAPSGASRSAASSAPRTPSVKAPTPPKPATPPSQQNANAKPPSAQHAEAQRNQAKPPAAQNATAPTVPGTRPAGTPGTAAAQGTTPARNQAAPPAAQNNAKVNKVSPPGEKAYTPPRADVRPPAKDYDRAARLAPDRLSRTGSYRSPVTSHIYVWHEPTYYSSSGYRLDLYDPFNPWNYTNPFSPFYGRSYNLVDRCR